MIKVSKNEIILSNRTSIGSPRLIPLELIMNKIYADQDRLVIIGGSYADGLATEFSDLDIMVFSEKIPPIASFDMGKHNDSSTTYNGWMQSRAGFWSTHDFVDGSTQQIEVTYFSFQALHDSINQLNSSYNNSFDDEYLLSRPFKGRRGLSPVDKELLHRLNVSVCLEGSSHYKDFKNLFSVERFCWVNHLENQAKYTYFKDILGLLRLGHFLQAQMLFFRMYINLLKSLLHLNFYTNTKSKWALELLRSLPEKYDGLKEKVYFSLENAPTSMDYFLNCFDIMDEMFLECLDCIDQNYGPDFRKHLYDINSQSYQRRDKFHEEIKRSQAFSERHFSRDFTPTREFFANNQIQPILLFR